MKMFAGRRATSDESVAVRAGRAQENKNWEEAHRLWHQVTRTEPDSLNGWLQLGNMANELARYEEALRAFDQASRLDPSSPDPMAGRAGVLERAGRWGEAHETWQLLASTFPLSTHPGLHGYALLHSALCLVQIDRSQQASEVLRLLERISPAVATNPQFLSLRIRTLPNLPAERARLVAATAAVPPPEDPGQCFELATLLLDGEQYSRGLDVLQPALARRPKDISFLWLAADLNERLNRHGAVIALSERMADLDPADERYLRRGFDAARRADNLIAARRLAILFHTRHGRWELAHGLVEAYREDGQVDRARLLCRWLRRTWPHSTWHKMEYIRLTARSRSLDEADRLVREYIEENGRGEELVSVYAEIAFKSGSFMEAVRRLRFLLGTYPDNEGAAILLGYAIANAIGFTEADLHFVDVATRQFQSRDALVGLAHMAMRRRDRDGTYERWLKVVGVHPRYDIGHVELARSAYELRRLDLVREICQRRLAQVPRDATMGEFYAWFLVATGKYQEAWALLLDVSRNSASWSVIDLQLQTAHQLGFLDREMPRIVAALPQASTRESGRRLYQVIRSLHVCGRDDLMPMIVDGTTVDPDHLAWLWPYLRPALDARRQTSVASPRQERDRRIATGWQKTRSLVRGDLAEMIRGGDTATIDQILARPKHELPVINIVNKFEQVSGGSELHALDIAERVSQYARVALWAPEMPHPHFTERRGVQAIEPAEGRVPHGGVLVLIGVYFDIAGWLTHARPERVIFLYNTFEAPMVFQRVQEVWERCGIRSELLFCSDMMGDELDLPGLFEPSPTDIVAFSPRKTARPVSARLRLGRHSRDVVEKHHAEDWKIYQAVSEEGGESTVLGGTCMSASFPPVEGLELLPARSGDMVPFLQSLDCYFYRTSSWIEPWGRVVVEAMACGLPVIASRNGGYAQIIDHGRNGLLFDTTDEAVALLRQVFQSAELRAKLGRNARATAEQLLGDESMRRLVSFYLAG